MGLTERHWFENDEPELTERQLEDIVYENKKAYEEGYKKGYSDRDKEIVRCKDCKDYGCDTYLSRGDDNWFCADGKRKET